MTATSAGEQWSGYSRGQQAWWVLTFVVAGVSWWMYQGPFRWTAEAMLALFGSYSANVAFMLSVLLVGMPGQYLFRSVGGRSQAPQAGPDGEWSARQLWFFAIPLGLLAIAAYFYHQAGHLKREPMRAAELEWGAQPPSRWLAVDGVVLAEAALCLKYNECYVPLVSEDWKPVIPVAVFLKTSCGLDQIPEAGPYEGVVSYRGMPGHVRVAFERSRVKPRSGFLVLDWQRGPENVRQDGLFLCGVSGVIALVIAFGLARDYRRSRVLQKALVETRAAERARQLGEMRGTAARGGSVADPSS